MSKPSPKSSPAPLKRFAFILVLFATAGVLLLLPQGWNALMYGAQPVQAASSILRPAAKLMPGAHDFWHTEGNRILDAHSRPVRISGMNWSGFETRQAVPGGLDVQDYRVILRTIKQNGYTTIRIPFSNEMIEMPSVPDRVSFSNVSGPINTDLHNLTSLEILDKIVAYSGTISLKIVLDNHRSEAGSSAQESGLWYTPQFPESAWIGDWTALARRYQGNSTVIGMDLRNEPHNAEKGGSCWDCGGANDWHRAAQRAGNAVLAVNPRLLIFVEGVDSYAGDSYWWGGNLEGVRRSPVHLSVANRLVYSAHEYGPSEYAQPWFNESTSPATLASLWRRHWAFVSEAGIAPVWVGEFGTPNGHDDVESSVPGSEGQWFASLLDYLGTHPAVGWTYWGVNSEDRYGLLSAGYSAKPANQQKAEALISITQTMSHEAADQVAPGAPFSLKSDPSLSATYNRPSLTAAAPPEARDDSPVPIDQIAQPIRTVVSPHVTPRTGGAVRHTPHHTVISSASVRYAIAASVRSAVSNADQSLTEGGSVVSR